uniref:Uncharacterized protein n=1 Tax=Octopus bimaculoides TaxID=37653 RepID=A0A0L8G1B6_OCTBM
MFECKNRTAVEYSTRKFKLRLLSLFFDCINSNRNCVKKKGGFTFINCMRNERNGSMKRKNMETFTRKC